MKQATEQLREARGGESNKDNGPGESKSGEGFKTGHRCRQAESATGQSHARRQANGDRDAGEGKRQAGNETCGQARGEDSTCCKARRPVGSRQDSRGETGLEAFDRRGQKTTEDADGACRGLA